MADSFIHLQFDREEPITDKRPPGNPRSYEPTSPSSHAKHLQGRLQSTKNYTRNDVGGFDQKKLLKLKVRKGFAAEKIAKLADTRFDVISQEDDTVVVAFASEGALASFEQRLATMVAGKHVTNKHVIYALENIDGWTPDDRKGWAFRHYGLPELFPAIFDVELWPLEDKPHERDALWMKFEEWIGVEGITKLDAVKNANLSLYRIKCDQAQIERLLMHRDVRTVDLPPKFGFNRKTLLADIQEFPEVPQPAEGAPGIVVLDSGIATGHPILGPAIGDSQSYLNGKSAQDENGHGTKVSGVALYGDLEARIHAKSFVPEIRIFGARILDENNENTTGFVENQIEEAVKYFKTEYNCLIFNLSFGDRNKPYISGHVKGLAITIDRISRDYGVLFVVSAGNITKQELDGVDWKNDYPNYLSSERWAIIDPATALNALTVGSLARYDQSFRSQIYSSDPSSIPIARKDQPSPFTRHGPSVAGAIKPELVAYGGNWSINTTGGANDLDKRGFGILTTNMNFATEGRLFTQEIGTSLAAPFVSHLAAILMQEYPDASANLIRALLVGHAQVTSEANSVVPNDIQNICGYGVVDTPLHFRSTENIATMVSEAKIRNKKHHFYELPIPEDFIGTGKRYRELTVSLAYTPAVRSTRIDYKATRLEFKLVACPDLAYATKMFNAATEKDDYTSIPELSNASTKSTLRGKGTVQSATWSWKQFTSKSVPRNKKLFIVVTRNDFPWGESISATDESYALIACMRDRENQQAQLYSQIRGILQARQQARARGKVNM